MWPRNKRVPLQDISLVFVLPAEVSHCVYNLAVLILQSFTHAYKHCCDICDSLFDLLCKKNASSKCCPRPFNHSNYGHDWPEQLCDINRVTNPVCACAMLGAGDAMMT